MAEADHPAVPNGLRLTYAGGANKYPGFDRFGRVVWQRWLRTDGSAADRYFYGYDRSGNRKWRAERSNVSTGSGRDEAYVYDGLDRLVGAKRGVLPYTPYQAPYPGDATKDGVVDGTDAAVVTSNWDTTGEGRRTWTQGELNGDGYVNNFDVGMVIGNWAPGGATEDVVRSWSWGLSSTGNWTTSMIDGNNQTRTHDNANQILSISGVTLAPLYDEAGNNVRGPRPADPNANNAAHFRYDAWNRLATIHLDDGNTPGTLDANDTLLATYRYDGLNRRVMKAVDVDGNSVTDYVYHNEGWQIVEVRRGVNQTPTTSPYKQFVYDIRYIDSPVCRWWDADGDGTMEPTAGEMQYFTNDGNFNTTALIDANSGSVVERYLYDPYGRVTVLNGAAGAEKDPNVSEWSPDADNKSDWDNEILFCGYWHDPETGLYHVRERYYDPITGTWKTRDRILYPDGMNLYEYVRSNPSRFNDPLGLAVIPITINTPMPPMPSRNDAETVGPPFPHQFTVVDKQGSNVGSLIIDTFTPINGPSFDPFTSEPAIYGGLHINGGFKATRDLARWPNCCREIRWSQLIVKAREKGVRNEEKEGTFDGADNLVKQRNPFYYSNEPEPFGNLFPGFQELWYKKHEEHQGYTMHFEDSPRSPKENWPVEKEFKLCLLCVHHRPGPELFSLPARATVFICIKYGYKIENDERKGQPTLDRPRPKKRGILTLRSPVETHDRKLPGESVGWQLE